MCCALLKLPSFRRRMIHTANNVIQINDTNKPSINSIWRLVCTFDVDVAVADADADVLLKSIVLLSKKKRSLSHF